MLATRMPLAKLKVALSPLVIDAEPLTYVVPDGIVSLMTSPG
jgi:hypothetical protein